jgi:hypothetical protein
MMKVTRQFAWMRLKRIQAYPDQLPKLRIANFMGVTGHGLALNGPYIYIL